MALLFGINEREIKVKNNFTVKITQLVLILKVFSIKTDVDVFNFFMGRFGLKLSTFENCGVTFTICQPM